MCSLNSTTTHRTSADFSFLFPDRRRTHRQRRRRACWAESSSAKITAPRTATTKSTDNMMDMTDAKNKYARLKQTCPTVVSFVTDALVFRVKHSFLQHAQDDDRTNPELDPQQIPPITSTPEEPERPEQHVHDAHHHEELRG
ncbi:hypothetical protein XENOCAPTIV_028300 [Xenoophorus captivus]|uniref:Uncharacterized protein n=1 Tax=Xenoophorus captivus TaxID=1517983 RepID=A0ABV0RE75_9TELE